MAKAVEITFAIGAALTGGFSGAFGKAGQALGALQKEITSVQKVSGQIEAYQKMQGAIASNETEVASLRQQAQSLDTQITASKANTSELSTQYRAAQQEVERLTASHVRNSDAYDAAKLNVKSLENQIRASSQPTDELQRQYAKAKEEARQLGTAVKQSSTELNAAKTTAQKLKSEMQASSTQTQKLQNEAKDLTTQADKLQTGIDRDREALSKMRNELTVAGRDTNNLASEQARLTQQSQRLADAQTRLQNSRAALQETRQKLSWGNIQGDLIKSAGIGYSLYKPTMIAADFEQAMARTKAVAFTGKNKTPEQKAADDAAFKELQEQALQLGRDTQFTAIQAAQSQEMLARAGFKSQEIISAMPGLLSMAAAEGMDLANAADIAASTLRGFNLEADQSGRVADVLAQMSAASNSSISGLGESMKYVAPIASGLGVSVEETAAMLGVMANAGIKGSQAGTALRAAFTRLSKEPKAVEKALRSLGVATRDAQGRMRKMPGLMQELSDKMKNMGEADQMQYLTNIFGQEAASGMLAVMRASVDGTLKEYEMLGHESTGVISKMAEMSGVKIEEMRANLKSLEPALGTLGLSFQETSIMMAMVAKSGIKNSDATLALMETYRRLTKEPKQVQKALKGMNISLYDSNKKMKNLPALMDELQKAMAGMSEGDQMKSLTEIFGVAAAPAIMKMIQGLADGTIEEYRKAAKETTGISHEMADTMQDTLRGQMTIAGSAIEGLMIEIGNVIAPYAKLAVYGFTRVISGITKFLKEHPIAKTIIGWVAGISALSVGITALKYSWLAIKLPIQSMRVAMDLANAKMLLMGKTSIWTAAKTKIMTAATKAWHVVMKAGQGLLNVGKMILYGAKSLVVATAKGAWTAAEWLWVAVMKVGRGLLDVGRLVLYGAKTIAVSVATKAWAAAQGLWNVAMKAGNGLLNIGKLVLYYGKQIAIAAATKAWTAAQWLWNAAMNANPIGLIVIAIAGLVAAGYYLYKNWDFVSAWWGKKWEWLSDIASSTVASVRNIIVSIKDWASQYFKLDFSGMWEGLKSALASVKNTIYNVINAVKSLFTLDFSGVWNNLKAAGESLMGVYEGIGKAIGSLFNIDASQVFEGIKTAFNGVVEFISGIGKTIAGISTFDFSGLKEGLSAAWNGAADVIAGIGKTFAGLFNIDFTGMWDGFMSGFDSACSYVSGKLGELTDWVGSGFSSAWNWTKGLFGYGEDTPEAQKEQLQVQVKDVTVLNKMSESFSERVAEMTRAWQPFKDSLGEGFEQLYTLMQGVADKIRGVVIPAVKELTASLSGVATEIASIVQAGGIQVEVRTPNTQSVQSYNRTVGSTWGGRRRAEGGIITRPEISLIGEAGREAIIPLERQSRGSELWFEAGRELGLIAGKDSITSNSYSSLNSNKVRNTNTIFHPSEHNSMNVLNEINSTVNNMNASSSFLTSFMNGMDNMNLLKQTVSESKKQLSNMEYSSEANTMNAGSNFLTSFMGGVNTLNSSSVVNNAGVMPSIINAMKFQPAMPDIGSIISQTYTGSNDEYSLEDTTRDIPLWLWADKDIGGSFSSSTTNNSRPVTISPNINITVNSGNPGMGQEIRRIIEEVISDIRDREERVSFD